MVLYLKYRPQSLSELIGQDVAKSTLQKAYEGGKLAHAYVFYGPRGTGKTSTARILAKMINCENQKSAPCNQCQTCMSITGGTNLDVLEIDAASNRGIDDIRELRERVKLAPSSSKKKVYIIDEAHMLTTEAFNALLKTLEEPPSHVLFVLATTEVTKIPATILSRVQKLNFSQATAENLILALQKVVDGEQLVAANDALALIAKKSEGSFRDALKIIDQLSSVRREITVGLVEDGVKSGSFEQAVELLDSLAEKNAPKALERLSDHIGSGVNFKEYIGLLTDLLRSMLFIKLDVSGVVKAQEGSERFEVLVKLAGKLELQQLIGIIENLMGALEKMRYASIAILPLEVALVESCLDARPAYNALPQRIVFSGVPGVEENRGPSKDDVVLTEDAGVNMPRAAQTSSPTDDVVTLQDRWTYILETVKPFNYSLEALLRSARLLGCENGRVILEVPYSFHQRILEAPKNREMLESILSDVLQKAARIDCVLGKRPSRPSELANVEVAADDEVIRLAAEIFNAN